MKLSIDIDDAELNEVITNGIKGLSTETITDMAKEALNSYLQTEDGTARFYVIDSADKDFYPYKAPSTHRNLFLYLFIICASIAVAEALIIGILFYRRRIAYRRQVKPRRV